MKGGESDGENDRMRRGDNDGEEKGEVRKGRVDRGEN